MLSLFAYQHLQGSILPSRSNTHTHTKKKQDKEKEKVRNSKCLPVNTCRVPSYVARPPLSWHSIFPRYRASFGIWLHRTDHLPLKTKRWIRYSEGLNVFQIRVDRMPKEKWNLVGKEENGCKSTRTELLHHLVLLFYLVNNVVQMVQYMIYI